MVLQNTRALLSQVVHFQVAPFENLMVQFYTQLEASLAYNLHEQKFTSLLVNVLSDRCKHVFVHVQVQGQALDY
jgi:hypothetical protein